MPICLVFDFLSIVSKNLWNIPRHVGRRLGNADCGCLGIGDVAGIINGESGVMVPPHIDIAIGGISTTTSLQEKKTGEKKRGDALNHNNQQQPTTNNTHLSQSEEQIGGALRYILVPVPCALGNNTVYSLAISQRCLF